MTTTTTSTTTTTGVVEACDEGDLLCFSLGEPALIGRQVGALAVIDTTDDDFPDLIAATDNGLYQVVNAGDGSLGPEIALIPDGAWRAIAIGDVDGDGVEDVVGTRTAMNAEMSGAMVVVLSDGGPFLVHATYSGIDAAGVALTDVDGDEELDVIVTLEPDGAIALYRGDGDGGFFAATEVAAGIAPSQVIASAIDDDAIADVALINYGSATLGTSLIVEGDLSEVISYVLPGAPSSLVGASLQAGSRDIVVATELADEMTIFRADDIGGLADVGAYPLGGAPGGLASADFTGEDGDDIVVALPSLSGVGFWLNDGSGGLYPYTTYAVTTDPSAVAVLRINDDARVDLAVGSDGLEGGVHILLSDPVP